MSGISRRMMLRLSATAAGLALVRIPRLDAGVDTTLSHGLLFDAADVPAMRRLFSDDPRFAELRERLLAIDRPSERAYLRSVRTNDQLNALLRLSGLAESTAFLWLMTGDEDAARLAAETVRTIMRFRRWDFFQDGSGEVIGVQRAPAATIAVALVADWLGDRVEADEREAWLRTMGERGCEACYRSLRDILRGREATGWSFDPTSTFFEHRPGNRTDLSRRPEITRTTNLRAVPAGGLAIGALALRRHAGGGADVDRWLEMALVNLRAFGSIFEPDGSYHEGASYAYYTAVHLAEAISALRRSGGPEPGDIVNWKGHVDYLLNMSLPTTIDPFGVVNFGDNGNPQTGERGTVSRRALPYWIARETGGGHAQWVGNRLGGSPDIRALIWFDPSVGEREPAEGPGLWRSQNDRIVARTGYTPDDLVVAMRSGPPANHEHADRNSVIVKCFGEQLVTDPNRPPYSFADPAWSMRLTAAHSAVLVDGRGHAYHNGVEGTNASMAHARILRSEHGERHALWVSDATQAYRLENADIRSVVRGVAVLYGFPAVILVDRLCMWQAPALFQARFFGYNWDGELRQELRPDGFRVRRPGAVMDASAVSPHPFRVQRGLLPVPEEQARRHPFVELSTAEAAREATLVTVLTIGRPESRPASVRGEASAEGLLVEIRSEAGAATCRIRGDGAVPEIVLAI